MRLSIENACLLNVWEDSFKDRETGEDVKYCRALLSVPGEAPMQFAVAPDDFASVSALIGNVGDFAIDLDAQPGRRMRVRLVGMA